MPELIPPFIETAPTRQMDGASSHQPEGWIPSVPTGRIPVGRTRSMRRPSIDSSWIQRSGRHPKRPRPIVRMALGSASQLALPPMPLGVESRLLAPRSMSLQPLKSSGRAGHPVEFLKKDLSRQA